MKILKMIPVNQSHTNVIKKKNFFFLQHNQNFEENLEQNT